MSNADLCFYFKDHRYGYQLEVYESLISDTDVTPNETDGSVPIPIKDYKEVVTKLKNYLTEQIPNLGKSSFENKSDLLEISISGTPSYFSEYKNNSDFWNSVIDILKPIMHNHPSVQ